MHPHKPPGTATARANNHDGHVLVVGAGISGLVAAHTAAQSGWRVTLLERAPQLGGPIAPVALKTPAGEIVVDGGAEAILNRRPEGVALAEELGLADQLTYPATSHAMIYRRGHLHPMPSNTAMGIPTEASQGLAGLFDEDAQQRIRDAQPQKIEQDCSVAHYVNTVYGADVTDSLVEPLLGGVYAGHSQELSLESTMPAIWQAACAGKLAAPAGTGAGGIKSSRSTAPVNTPVFAGLVGGIHTLIAALEKNLDSQAVTVQRGTTVTSLRQVDTGWQVDVDSEPACDTSLHASRVLLATQAPQAASLLADIAPRAATILRQTPTASMALVTLAVPRTEMADLPFSGVLVPPSEGLTVKAITFSTTKWQWLADQAGEYAILRASLGRQGDNVIGCSDTELVTTALSDLNTILDRDLATYAHQVTRWPDALPQYIVGHQQRIRDIQDDIDTCPGLAITGSLFNGLGIPACIQHARTTTTHLLTS